MARKRKSRQKWRRSKRRDEQGDNPTFSTTLEEDLRQQRLNRSQQETPETQQEDNASEGGSELGPLSIRGADPVPRSSSFWRQPLLASRVMSAALSGIGYMHETSTVHPARRRDLRTYWYGKYLFDNSIIRDRAASRFGKVKWLDTKVPDGTFCAWDISPKYYLHASARTFDVSTGWNESTKGSPAIVSALHGGFACLYHDRDGTGKVQIIKQEPVQAIRFSHSHQGLFGTVTVGGAAYSTPHFRVHSESMVSAGAIYDLLEPVHDLAFGQDIVIFSPCKPRHGDRLAPLFVSLESSAGVRSLQCEGLIQSDALRLDFFCDEKLIAFAHRNGQVTLWDLRQNMCSSLGSGSSVDEFGCATDLLFLASSRQLVVKRSFGASQLHDLRKLCAPGNPRKEASLLYSMLPPESKFLSTLSSSCNGLAVDPGTGKVLFAPFLDEEKRCSMGFWSLNTGEYLAAKVVLANAGQEAVFGELSSRLAPLASSREHRLHGEVGFYCKAGLFSSKAVNAKAGSLHQISLPGSFS